MAMENQTSKSSSPMEQPITSMPEELDLKTSQEQQPTISERELMKAVLTGYQTAQNSQIANLQRKLIHSLQQLEMS